MSRVAALVEVDAAPPGSAQLDSRQGLCQGRTLRADGALIRRINRLYHDLTQDVFDAEHRARHRAERGFWREVAQSLNNHGSTRQGRIIVDLACGTGFVTQILSAGLGPTDRLVAIDISGAALATTVHKCRTSQLVPAAGDGAALPLPSASVDLFAINAALHHMPNPSTVLREIDRVLKPGGWFALGFEPNVRHYASPIRAMSRGIDRLAWYASPRQNVRRLRTRLGSGHIRSFSDENDRRVTRLINQSLVEEQWIKSPLATATILDCVDPHARGADAHAGFNATALMAGAFAGYEVVRLISSDYLGEAARRSRPLREAADATLRALIPAHGSLFSWVIRKPLQSGGHGD
jgi:trans-aconitate methyltransferase